MPRLQQIRQTLSNPIENAPIHTRRRTNQDTNQRKGRNAHSPRWKNPITQKKNYSKRWRRDLLTRNTISPVRPFTAQKEQTFPFWICHSSDVAISITMTYCFCTAAPNTPKPASSVTKNTGERVITNAHTREKQPAAATNTPPTYPLLEAIDRSPYWLSV